MKTQAMVDIETLSSNSDAAVIAIGLCLFDGKDVWGEHEILIDPQFTPGYRDPDTLDWWSTQDQEVFQKMMSGMVMPWDACDQMISYFDAHPGVKQLWANPPSFDITILRHLFKLYDKSFPIHFTGERDFRTMRKFADGMHIDYKEPYEEREAHDAKSDAVCQAKAIQLILQGLALL